MAKKESLSAEVNKGLEKPYIMGFLDWLSSREKTVSIGARRNPETLSGLVDDYMAEREAKAKALARLPKKGDADGSRSS